MNLLTRNDLTSIYHPSSFPREKGCKYSDCLGSKKAANTEGSTAQMPRRKEGFDLEKHIQKRSGFD